MKAAKETAWRPEPRPDWRKPAAVEASIVAILEDRPRSTDDLYQVAGVDKATLEAAIAALDRAGTIYIAADGRWESSMKQDGKAEALTDAVVRVVGGGEMSLDEIMGLLPEGTRRDIVKATCSNLSRKGRLQSVGVSRWRGSARSAAAPVEVAPIPAPVGAAIVERLADPAGHHRFWPREDSRDGATRAADNADAQATEDPWDEEGVARLDVADLDLLSDEQLDGELARRRRILDVVADQLARYLDRGGSERERRTWLSRDVYVADLHVEQVAREIAERATRRQANELRVLRDAEEGWRAANAELSKLGRGLLASAGLPEHDFVCNAIEEVTAALIQRGHHVARLDDELRAQAEVVVRLRADVAALAQAHVPSEVIDELAVVAGVEGASPIVAVTHATRVLSNLKRVCKDHEANARRTHAILLRHGLIGDPIDAGEARAFAGRLRALAERMDDMAGALSALEEARRKLDDAVDGKQRKASRKEAA